jgi:hypothetical protein
MSNTVALFAAPVLVLAAVLLYCLPSILADARGRDDAAQLTLFNVLLGWTIVGWVAAFLWVQQRATPRAVVTTLRRSRRLSAASTIAALSRRAQARSKCDGQMINGRCVKHG